MVLDDDMRQCEARPPPTSLLSLPVEIQTRIITLACLSSVPVRHIERKTTFNLMLVSRSIYSLAAAQLYRNVRIRRPSVLADFERALSSRPSLGRLVRNLDLGPDSHLPHDWWPMRYLVETPGAQLSRREMTTSLVDEKLLPRWCGPHRGWSLTDEHASWSCRDYYVLEALDVAQISFNTKLREPNRAVNREMISTREWLIGVMEAQAVLDLYLMEMRRREDKGGYHVPKCGKRPFSTQGPADEDESLPCYPPLVIAAPTSSSSRNVAGQALVLHREQLAKHLTRRGATTDYFDHPLISARSSLNVLTFERDGQAKASKLFWPQLAELYRDVGQSSAQPTTGEGKSLVTGLFDLRVQSSLYPSTATVEGILALARSVLSATTQLQHLCLTGLLQLSLCGPEALPSLPSLRTLALGPTSLCHTDSLTPSPAALPSLEKLYLVGHQLSEHKVDAISALPKLREVYWDLTHSSWSDVFPAILPLFGADALAQPTDVLSLKRSRPTSEEDGNEGAAPLYQSHSRSTLVQVSISIDCEKAMRSALSAKARAAWDERHLVSEEPYRVEILLVYPPNRLGGDERWDMASEDVAMAYQELDDASEYFLTGRWPWDCLAESQVA